MHRFFAVSAFVIVALVAFLIMLTAQDGADRTAPTTQAQTQRVSTAALEPTEGTRVLAVDVEGMHCSANCAPRVHEAVSGLPGVTEASVSVGEGAAWVRVPTESELTAEEVALTINEKTNFSAKEHEPEVQEDAPGEPLTETEGTKVLAVNVEGMSCQFSCAPQVHEAVTGVEGILQASVSYEDGAAWVRVPADSELTAESIAATINEQTHFRATTAEATAGAETSEG